MGWRWYSGGGGFLKKGCGVWDVGRRRRRMIVVVVFGCGIEGGGL